MERKGLIRVNGKLEEAKITYQEPDHRSPYGFGEPISENGAKALIKNYSEALKKNKKLLKEVKELNYLEFKGFTIGKEALMAILSQRDCEGIRFYLANKSDEDWGKGKKSANWKSGITFVAIGVDDKQREIGAEKGKLYQDFERIANDMSTPNTRKSNKNGGHSGGGIIFETVPPIPK